MPEKPLPQSVTPSTAPAVSLPDAQMLNGLWPVGVERRHARRGHHPVFSWLRMVFVALMLLAVISVLAATWVAWHQPEVRTPVYLALIAANVLIAGLMVMSMLRKLLIVILDRRGRLRGGTLHRRVLGVFGLLAVVPALCVAGLAVFLLNQGISSWFAQPVGQALEGGRQVAEGYVEETSRSLMAEGLALARDEIWQRPLLLDQASVQGWLKQQAQKRQLDEIMILDNEGLPLASASMMTAPGLPSELLGAMQNSRAPEPLAYQAANGITLAVVPLGRAGWWLAVQRALPLAMQQRLRETETAYYDYKQLAQERATIRNLSTLFVLLVMAATLAGVVWAGTRLANRIVRPVTALVHGTNRISAGDFSVRLEPKSDDELGVLTQAFNRMALQLANQRDLLEKKNRELDDRRRLMEAIITGVSAGVVALDEAGIVRVANHGAQQLLGVVPGLPLVKQAPALQDFWQEAQQLASAGQLRNLFQREVRVPLGDGEFRTLLVRLVPQAPGSEGGAVLSCDDLTPLMGAQRIAAWRDVARRLAHEIKNPLTPIQLSAERLKRKYLAQMPESDQPLFKQLTETIIAQAEEMRRMTNEFSDFARMPQSQPVPVNLVHLLDDAVALQRGRRNIQFSTSYANAPMVAMLDAGQVGRVLNNLLENAANAIDERAVASDSGTEVTPGRVEIVACKSQDGMLLIEIHDNGRGLPDNVAIEHLFDPYVTTRKGGTGLGLAIVKKVMDEHNGTVRLKRRSGGGTTVELQFPAVAAHALTVDGDAQPDPPTAQATKKEEQDHDATQQAASA